MRKYGCFFAIAFCVCCGVKEKSDEYGRINAYLKRYLKTDYLEINRSWGSDSLSNHLEVILTDFDFHGKDDKYLDSVSTDIRQQVKELFPDTRKLYYIEVRFEAPDSIGSGRKTASFR